MCIIPQFPQNEPQKTCTKCGHSKPLSEYYVKVKATGRLFSWCKDCHQFLTEKWREENKERHNQSRKAWRVANPDKVKAMNQALRERHREVINDRARQYRAKPENKIKRAAYRQVTHDKRKAYNDAYRQAKREQIKASNAVYREARKAELKERQRAWREANPDRYREIHRKYKQSNPDKQVAQFHKRHARILANGGSYTVEEWELLKAACDYRCLMCDRQEPEIKLTVDHITPVSQGGSNDIDNIQPLCKSCNSKKHTKRIDFRRS